MRLLFTLVVAALEATAVSLPLTLLAPEPPPWPLLLLAVAMGWLADQLSRRGPVGRQRATLLAGAALGALLLPAIYLGGPLAALGALLPGSPAFLAAYALLLLGLFLVWRGTRLDTSDSGAIGERFRWAMVAGLVALILGAFAGGGAPLGAPVVLWHVAGLNALGLLAMALGHAQDAAGGRLTGLSWRWLATLAAVVAGVVAAATLATSLVGGGAGAEAARTLIGLFLLPFALVGAALAWVFLTLFAEPLAALLRAILAQLQLLQLPEGPTDPAGEGLDPVGGPVEVIARMAEGATFLMALIPIVILVAAILLLRSRLLPRDASDEERESLGTAAGLAADLRDLLGRLRNPFARHLEGLRGALAALKGDDPTARARRAYIGLLLLLEGRARHRPPAATPAEFRAAAAEATGAPEPVAALTAAYERARYSPAGATATDAATAEDALRALERGER